MVAENFRPRKSLNDCATGLRDVDISTPAKEIEELIEDGYFYLDGMKTSPRCNPLQETALQHRLDHAEEVLQRLRKIEVR